MKDDFKILSLTSAYQFGSAHGLEEEIEKIKNMEIEWDLSYTSSLRRGYIIDLFQQNGIWNEFIDNAWPSGNTPKGQSKIRFFLNIKSRYEKFLSGEPVEDDLDSDEEISEQAFAAESDLRDFLASNLECIEKGLRIYSTDNRNGIEFPVASGRIDILAIDTAGKYVVIELKLSKGRNKTLGQLLYYMGAIDSELGNSPCRGIIVAREIPNDLKIATQRVSGISLYKYNLKVTLDKVF